MIKLRQYVPSFAEFKANTATVSSVAEMLALPWVNAWAKMPEFHRWSYKDRLLMAERDGGKKWWIVAMIEEGDVPAAELPDWVPPPYQAR